MINKKIYYSISEVSKILDIEEHTIRLWNSKIPGLSKQSEKGNTRFFSQQQISKISNLKNLLKNNDTLSLAYEIVSKNKLIENSLNSHESKILESSSNVSLLKISKIKKVIKNLNQLLNNQ